MRNNLLLAFSMLFFPYKPKGDELDKTLSWTAYHLFSPRFHDRWKNGKLFSFETRLLKDHSIKHRIKMLEKRKWNEFDLMKYDIYTLNLIKNAK